MDDWKLKARAVVKLKKKPNMFVSSVFTSRGVGKGDMSPGNSHTEKIKAFFVNTLWQWLLAYNYVFSFAPRPPTRLCPWTLQGDFCPQSPFCPPSKQISGYGPVYVLFLVVFLVTGCF